MVISWRDFEEIALRDALNDLDEFARHRKDEVFYGVTLWSNPPEIMIYMHTEGILRKEAEEFLARSKKARGQTVAEIMDEFRWGLDKYCVCDYISWDDYELATRQLTEEELGFLADNGSCEHEQFMELLCRVAIRLENSGGLSQFKRTDDFRTHCIDTSQCLEESDERMERVRASM